MSESGRVFQWFTMSLPITRIYTHVHKIQFRNVASVFGSANTRLSLCVYLLG